MALKHDGGPAFPIPTGQDHFAGMTLRDYFAGKALLGMLADSTRAGSWKDFAADAYAYADAMLKVREQ